MTFDTPDDLDFSAWRNPLLEKVDKFCSARTFRVPVFQFGRSLLDGLSDGEAQAKLHSGLASNPSSLRPYIARRWWLILAVVLGIIMFSLSIAASLGVNARMRLKYSQLLCGVCRPRSRPRFKNVKARFRSVLCVATVLCGGFALLVNILLLLGNSQLTMGTNDAACGVWSQMYGHFFGASELSKGDVQGIATSWVGTASFIEQVRSLREQVTPGPSNPLNVNLTAEKEILEVKANTVADVIKGIGDQTVGIYDFHQALLDNVAVTVKGGRGVKFDKPKLGVANIASAKKDSMKQIVADNLNTGWSEIDRLLLKYTGPSSALLNKAYTSTQDTLKTIQQIDASIAVLTRMWDGMGSSLVAVVLSIASIGFVISIVEVVGVLVAFALAGLLLMHLRHDSFITKQELNLWKTTYVIFVIGAGLSVLFCALTLLAGGIGNDTCHIINDSLFERGDWSILPDEAFAPVPNTTIDFKTVLDTCVRRSGTGDVAVAMALDGQIAELIDDVDAAKQDISDTRDRILDRQTQVARMQVLAIALRETLKSHYTDDPEAHIFPDFSQLHFDRKDRATEGRNNLLCFIPGINVMRCVTKGLWVSVESPTDAYSYVNKIAEAIHADTASKADSFPKRFCGYLGNVTSDCWTGATDESEIVYLDKIDPAEANEKVQDWLEGVRDDFTFDGFTDAKKRTNGLLLRLIAQENTAAAYPTLDVLKYPNATTCANCTYNEWRLQDAAYTWNQADHMLDNFTVLLDLVDQYVNEIVFPQMDSLTEKANAVTDGANCQFEGTSLDKAAVESFCGAAFPAMAFLSLLYGLSAIALGLLSLHTWMWVGYLVDISSSFHDSPSMYEVPGFTPMNARPEYVSYTGLPPVACGKEIGRGSVSNRTATHSYTGHGRVLSSEHTTPESAYLTHSHPLSGLSLQSDRESGIVVLAREDGGSNRIV